MGCGRTCGTDSWRRLAGRRCCQPYSGRRDILEPCTENNNGPSRQACTAASEEQSASAGHHELVVTDHARTSDAQSWASECPDVKNDKWRFNPAWHRMLYSCTHVAPLGVKGLLKPAAVVIPRSRTPSLGAVLLQYESMQSANELVLYLEPVQTSSVLSVLNLRHSMSNFCNSSLELTDHIVCIAR